VGGGTPGDGTALGGLPADSSNICEPLSSSAVCRGLNDSDTLCQPARWAGEAIQEAINATRAAMRSLEKALRLVHSIRLVSLPFLDDLSDLTSLLADSETTQRLGGKYRYIKTLGNSWQTSHSRQD